MNKGRETREEMLLRGVSFRQSRFSLKMVGRVVLITGSLCVVNGNYNTIEAHSSSIAEPIAITDEIKLDEVEVMSSRVQVPMQRSARIVSVMTKEEIKASPAQSVNDLLKYAAGVDVRQRGAFGIQTDISVGGGMFDQIVILLNGVNISSPHTGHLSADFPISIDEIERIEILEGAASRVYGTNAFTGAINIITRGDSDGDKFKGDVNIKGGSFNTYGADARVAIGGESFENSLSAGYVQSEGGTPNSDFKRLHGYYGAALTSELVDIDWQLGMSMQDYGANTFYSGKFPNQYEENSRYFASVSAKTKGRLSINPTLYWNRSTDHYQLIRGTSTGENYHITDVYGFSLNSNLRWALGVTSIGADLRNEGILSTSLGRELDASMRVKIPGTNREYVKRDNRTNVSYFLEHALYMGDLTATFGLMANMNSWLDGKFRLYPGIDVSYAPMSGLRIYASWNSAQRMPTFTDLYYKSPTQEGNVGLEPERTNEYVAGFRLSKGCFRTDIRAFRRNSSSVIDWVLYPSDSVNGYTTWHAANYTIKSFGLRADMVLDCSSFISSGWFTLKNIRIGYAYTEQDRVSNVDIYASHYAMEYLRHKIVLSTGVELLDKLSMELSYRWQERMGSYVSYIPNNGGFDTKVNPFLPYGILDMRLKWVESRYEIFLDSNNLTSTKYCDIGGIMQPGFWCMGGIKVRF